MNGSKMKTVEILIEFMRIGEIDTMNEKYQAEVYVESKWITNEKITTYNPNEHWNPKLYIENTFQEPKETIKYSVAPGSNDNLVVTESRTIKGAFWEKLELHNFPFDIQQLSVTVTTRLSADDIKIVSDSSRRSKINFNASNTFIDQQKWRLFKLVKVNDSQIELEEEGLTAKVHPLSFEVTIEPTHDRPKIKASCYCARKAGYYFFNAFFLIFLITGTALTVFSIDRTLNQNRIPPTVTFLMTSVSFKWVTNRYLPTISYLTSLDKYQIVCLFFICLLCVWHSIVGALISKDVSKDIDTWALVGFGCLFFLINLYFLVWLILAYRKVWKLSKQEEQFIKELKNSPDFILEKAK